MSSIDTSTHFLFEIFKVVIGAKNLAAKRWRAARNMWEQWDTEISENLRDMMIIDDN